MKKNLTEIVFILDRSGSMNHLAADTIGGFNSMLSRQKALEGEAYVSTVLFDSASRVIHDRVPIENVREMTEEDYVCGGCTALLDALGGAIRHIKNIHKYAREEDVPEKTIFIITTDGMENASRMYTSDEVKRMISHEQEKYGWEFLFIAANIDAVETASRYGIRKERAINHIARSSGTRAVYESISNAIEELRVCESISDGWRAEIEKDNAK